MRDELLDGVLAVAGHGRRLAHGGGHQTPVHDEQAVVVAAVGLLDDDLVADLLGARERLAQVPLVADAGGDALAVVAVVRLDHDRVAEPLGVLDGGLDAPDDRPLGDGDAGVLQHVLGEPLVAGRLHADHARPRGDGGLDAALVLALAELDEVVVVEAEHGDAAMLRLLHDRRRGRTEVVIRADVLELADHALEVDVGAATLEERVDDVDRALPGRDPGLFDPVAEDDLIDARGVGVDGLAEPDFHAGDELQLQREVLDDVAEQRPLAHALDEAAALVLRAAVLLEAGDEFEQRVGEPGQGVGEDLVVLAEVDVEHDDRAVAVVVGASDGARVEQLDHGPTPRPGRCHLTSGRIGTAAPKRRRARRHRRMGAHAGSAQCTIPP